MQKFSVDIQRPGAPLVVHAKQGDTARAVQVSLYDGGVPYVPPDGAQPIVFYKTSAGMGNYSERVTLSGNTLDIPLIAQMLTSPGGGLMCVALVAKNKGQLATWNMEVHVECVPGMDSKPAKDWYTAMAEYVAQTLANVDQAKAEVQKAKDEVQRAKAEADRAASLTSRYDKDLAGSTVVTAPVVNCNLLEGTPLHVVSHIEPVQEGSGDPSPDNVRPIKGFTGAKLVRCGKNLFKLVNKGSSQQNGLTFTYNENGTFTVSGTATQRTVIYLGFALKGVQVESGFLSGCPASEGCKLEVGVATESGDIYRQDSGQGVGVTKGYFRHLAVIIQEGISLNNTVFAPQLELGSTPTPYEPYQGNEYTVQFGQTVYGGSYDWSKGTLIDMYEHLIADGSEEELWKKADGNTAFYWYPELSGHPKRLPSGEIFANALPTKDDYVAPYVRRAGESFVIDFGKGHPELTTVTKLREYLALHPLEVIYQKTPSEKKLTPQQVLALSGTNNLYSNTGDTTVSRLRAVPLSDATDSGYDASAGVAATPAAVKAAYDLAGTAKRDAATAQGAAETAQGAAETAQSAADAAQGAADDANRAAGNAQSTANAAADAASAAGTAARNAQGTADNALNKANAAIPKSGAEIPGLLGNANGVNVQGRWFRNTTVVNSGWVNVNSQWITLVRK